jgi:hypothetical protein
MTMHLCKIDQLGLRTGHEFCRFMRSLIETRLCRMQHRAMGFAPVWIRQEKRRDERGGVQITSTSRASA